jgi:hypothetical protein
MMMVMVEGFTEHKDMLGIFKIFFPCDTQQLPAKYHRTK